MTAMRESYYQRPNYRFLPTDRTYNVSLDSGFEFDEPDLYSNSPDSRRKPITSNRNGIKQSSRSSPVTLTLRKTVASSLPINVPDWSNIFREENRHTCQRSIENVDDGGDRYDGCDGGGRRLPPHEYLAKTKMASFYVHEGIGRTLKGRDLSRVRNAVFEKTGYLD